MSDLKAKFEQAAKDVHALSERPDNDTLLRLYALYKQGAEGDVFQVADGGADEIEAGRERSRNRPRRFRRGGGGIGHGRVAIRCPSPRGGWCAAWPRS